MTVFRDKFPIWAFWCCLSSTAPQWARELHIHSSRVFIQWIPKWMGEWKSEWMNISFIGCSLLTAEFHTSFLTERTPNIVIPQVTDSSPYSYLLGMCTWKSQEWFHFCCIGLLTWGLLSSSLIYIKWKENVGLGGLTHPHPAPPAPPQSARPAGSRMALWVLRRSGLPSSPFLGGDPFTFALISTCDPSSHAFVFEQSWASLRAV